MTRRQLNLQAMSEFAGYNDACGPNAEAMALAAVGTEPESVREMTAIRSRDIARGWFTPGGGEPLSSMYLDLTTYERGIQVVQYVPFAQPGDWLSALRPALVRYAGIYPCAIEVGNAQNLWGNEAGVQWHFVLIAGYDDGNSGQYLLLNGDDIRALQGQTYYSGRWISETDLISADVAGLIVVRKVGTMSVPNGWRDDGNTLTAPNGVPVIHGFRDQVLNYPGGWPSSNWPIAAETFSNPANPVDPTSGVGSIQYFYNSILVWTQAKNQVFFTQAGSVAYLWLQRPGSAGGGTEADPQAEQVKSDLKKWLAS
jgi:hypothetical protein